MRYPSLLLVVALLVGAPLLDSFTACHAQESDEGVQSSRPDVRVTLGGDFQARASAGFIEDVSRIGFGIRRARLAATTLIGEHVGVFLRADFAPGTLGAVDAYAFLELEQWRLQLGRFSGAQPRAMTLTSGMRTDAVDRAAIAERWASRTIGGDGRDFGFQAAYQGERSVVALFLHNGDGHWSRARGNYREGISGTAVTGGIADRSLAASVYASHEPANLEGVEIGAFASYNASRNPNTQERTYGSAAAHAYWGADPGSQPWRLKADVIATRYETVPVPTALAEEVVGLSLLAAHGPRDDVELFARYEYEHRDEDAGPDQFITVGAHWSPSVRRGAPFHHERFTLGYGLVPGANGEASQHLIVLQAQLVF